jgi:hypothetical protein
MCFSFLAKVIPTRNVSDYLDLELFDLLDAEVDFRFRDEERDPEVELDEERRRRLSCRDVDDRCFRRDDVERDRDDDLKQTFTT